MERNVHALIGCGRVAPNHVDGFRQVDSVMIGWACDRDPEVAQRFAAAHGIPKSTTEAQQVLNDPAVVSVSIAVDHAQHAGLAIQALKSGKHVLVEKPIATTLSDARAVCAAAAASGRVLCVVSQHRYDPLVRAVKHWIDNGLLGEIILLNVLLECGRDESYYRDSYWRGTWSGEAGSALINQAYHCVDLVQWFLGSARSVAAAMSTLAHQDVIETEDTVCAIVQGPTGALGTLACSTASHAFWRSRIDVVGRTGTVAFDIDHPNTLQYWSGDRALGRAVSHYLQEPRVVQDSPGIDYYGMSHRRQIADFCQAVQGNTTLSVDTEAAVSTLALIESLYDAGGLRRC
jgi:UDP-N-acetyl-2-amino-2-deoxyglucuronate dehydrogenase